MEKLVLGLWDEWLSVYPDSKFSANAEIVGLFEGMTNVYGLKNETEGETLTTRRMMVFNRLRRIWNMASLVQDIDFASVLIIPQKLKGKISLNKTKQLNDRIMTFKKNNVDADFNKNWIRGIWGSLGSVFKPKTGYYLVIRFPNENKSLDMARVILTKNKMYFSFRKRLGGSEISFRNHESIIHLFHTMNLTRTALAFEEEAIIRSMKNMANKLVNCDSSNIKRSIAASSKQIQLAIRAEELGIVESMPSHLKEIIIARLKNTSATLNEIGQSLQTPISKSTVEYRWKKIELIIEDIERGGVYNVSRQT